MWYFFEFLILNLRQWIDNMSKVHLTFLPMIARNYYLLFIINQANPMNITDFLFLFFSGEAWTWWQPKHDCFWTVGGNISVSWLSTLPLLATGLCLPLEVNCFFDAHQPESHSSLDLATKRLKTSVNASQSKLKPHITCSVMWWFHSSLYLKITSIYPTILTKAMLISKQSIVAE